MKQFKRAFLALAMLLLLPGLAAGGTNLNSLNAGLVGYWPLDQTHKSSATGYSDLSAQSNTGTAVGSPTATTDRFGETKALAFNGTNQYVDLSAHVADYAGLAVGSISVWFKPLDSAVRIMFSLTESTTLNNYVYILKNSDNKIKFRVTGAGASLVNIDSNSAVVVGAWTHIAITQNGSTSKMYINGALQAITDSGEWFSDVAFNTARIGNWQTSDVYLAYWKGSIAEPRIYNRALSQAEVTALYQSSGPGNITYTP